MNLSKEIDFSQKIPDNITDKQMKRQIYKDIKQRRELIIQKLDVENQLKALDDNIIFGMDRMGMNKIETSTATVSVVSNSYTKYDQEYYKNLFKDLTKAEKRKVMNPKITYSFSEDEMINLVQKGKFTLKKIQKGMDISESRRYIRYSQKRNK